MTLTSTSDLAITDTAPHPLNDGLEAASGAQAERVRPVALSALLFLVRETWHAAGEAAVLGLFLVVLVTWAEALLRP